MVELKTITKMTKKIVWRLKEQPSVDSLRELVSSGILTKEEAREILFSVGNTDEVGQDDLKSEIKFLRELVEKLSNNNNSKIVEIIREVEQPGWGKYPWYSPYITWCTSGAMDLAGSSGTTTLLAGDSMLTTATANTAFSNINTF